MAKATLHERAIIAMQSVGLLKSFAHTLRENARDFDCSWPLSIARDMEEWANEFSKKLK